MIYKKFPFMETRVTSCNHLFDFIEGQNFLFWICVTSRDITRKKIDPALRTAEIKFSLIHLRHIYLRHYGVKLNYGITASQYLRFTAFNYGVTARAVTVKIILTASIVSSFLAQFV